MLYLFLALVLSSVLFPFSPFALSATILMSTPALHLTAMPGRYITSKIGRRVRRGGDVSRTQFSTSLSSCTNTLSYHRQSLLNTLPLEGQGKEALLLFHLIFSHSSLLLFHGVFQTRRIIIWMETFTQHVYQGTETLECWMQRTDHLTLNPHS